MTTVWKQEARAGCRVKPAELRDHLPPEDTNSIIIEGFALDVLGPGVQGYVMEHDGALYVPLLIADEPGSGAVSRYLDSLPTDRTIRFPTVISNRLRGMLQRRGFEIVWERATSSPYNGESVEIFERKAGQ